MQEFVVLGCGIVKSRKNIVTKKGDRMAFLQLEDQSSTAEIVLFPSTFKKVEALLDDHHIFIVKGVVDISSPHTCKIKANILIPIDLFFDQWPLFEKISLTLPRTIDASLLEDTKKILTSGKTPLELFYCENGQKVRLSCRQHVTIEKEMIVNLEKKGIHVTLTP